MYTEKQRTFIRAWPTPQDYNECLQHPSHNLSDPILRESTVDVDRFGLPRPICGSFASVYRLVKDDKRWALRCFLHHVADQEQRYQHISSYVKDDTLSYTVECDFQPQGILVNSHWYPVLKMEWISGETLEQYVDEHYRDSQLIKALADQFKTMCADLATAQIAHGDLQHANIIVKDSKLYLVDYDGMYVPSMAGWKSNELGHRNYQHPKRTGDHFGPYIDNFAQWIIYTSLLALSRYPQLYRELHGGNDRLLFGADDFQYPTRSLAFYTLEEKTGDEELASLSKMIRYSLALPVPRVPPLLNMTDAISALPRIATPPESIQQSLLQEQTVEDEVQDEQANDMEEAAYPTEGDKGYPARRTLSKRKRKKLVERQNEAEHTPGPHNSMMKGTHNSTLIPKHHYERELLASAKPRKVCYQSAKDHPGRCWKTLLIPHVWFVLLGVPYCAFYGFMEATYGVDYPATITMVESQIERSKSGNPLPAQEIKYRYQIGAKHFEGKERYCGDEAIKAIKVGDKIQVRAFPGNPEFTARPSFDRSFVTCRDPVPPVGWLTFYVLIVGWILQLMWGECWRHKKLAQYGIPGPGKIISIDRPRSSIFHRNSSDLAITYEYSVSGQNYVDKCIVDRQDADPLHAGFAVTVLHDQANPDVSVIYKCCRYKVKK